MSVKSRNTSGRTSAPKAVNAAFDTAVLDRARKIAATYTVLLQPEPGIGFVGRGLELPLAMDEGRTADECVRKTRDAFVAAVATMLEKDEVPPPAAREKLRTEQINIRVTPEEKLLLEEAARSKGFRGVSDFVRTAGLNRI